MRWGFCALESSSHQVHGLYSSLAVTLCITIIMQFYLNVQTIESLSDMLRKKSVAIKLAPFETSEGVQSLQDPFVSSYCVYLHDIWSPNLYSCPLGHSVWFWYKDIYDVHVWRICQKTIMLGTNINYSFIYVGKFSKV